MIKLENMRRNPKWVLGASLGLVLLAGLAIRAAYWPELVSSATFRLPTTDASYHDHWAKGLAFGDWTPPADASADPRIPDQPFFRPPGYPYFLAMVYRVFGPGRHAPVWFNMGLDLGGALCVFFLARRIFGTGPALISALLAATYWGLVYFDGMLFEPALLFFLMAASLLACSRWTERIGWANSLAAGGLLGLGVLVRPNLLACVPVCLGWGLWLAWRTHDGWKSAVRMTAAFLGAWLLVLAPALWRNYRVSGAWPVLTTNGGINLYLANNPEADGMTSTLPRALKIQAGFGSTEWTSFDYPRIVATVSRLAGEDLDAVGADRLFRQLGRSYIRNHPRRTLRSLGKKTLLFWGPRELANNLPVETDRQHSRILRRSPGFSAVLAAALLGMVFFLRPGRLQKVLPAPPAEARTAPGVLLLLFAGTYFLSYLPFFIAARYRLPVVPLLLVFSGWGIWTLIHWLRARQFALAVCAVALTLAGHRLLALPVVPVVSEAYLWHGLQARALAEAGRHAEAAEMYRRAIALSPRETALHNNLGSALRETGDLEGARAAFLRAVELGPQVALPRVNLARIERKLVHLDEAERHYRAALALRPEQADWWRELGNLLAWRGRMAEADECFRTAQESERRASLPP